MLSSLHIENVAVLRSVDIDFSGGFSAFTGETGAGKSMIIDSVNLLLGNRGDRDMIRAGEERALVSAVFSDLSPETLSVLADNGFEPDADGTLMLQRTLMRDGRSGARINGRSVTLSLLRTVGASLISIHGQHDTRLLSDPESYVRILDTYAHNEEILGRYAAAYAELLRVRRAQKALEMDEGERLRTAEMLRFQIADIDALKLKAGEEEKLEEKRLRLQSAEKISRQTSFAYRALKGSEKGSVSYILSRSIQALRQLTDVIPQTAELSARLEEALLQVDDVAEQVYDLGGEEQGDPTELLNRVEGRLDAIGRLRRKYGGSVAEILAFRETAARRLSELEASDDRIAALQAEEQEKAAAAAVIADELHEKRADAAARLTEEITASLAFLDMPRVRFEVRVDARRDQGAPVFDRHGYDDIAFLIATNPGETPGPIDRIASGGELSRIMLALKSVITDRDGISTVIYDEVDTGISGKTARKIGIKLHDAAGHTQIFSVTHSAQIASLADSHYLIEKTERNGRSETTVRLLDRAARVEELARILGGLRVTDAQKKAAEDMLDGRL